MADVTLTYNGQNILEMSATGRKTLKTAKKRCKTDIEVSYVKSGGGGSGYNILKGSAPPSAGIGQDGDVYLQYDALDEIVNTYVKVNGAWQALVGSDVDDVTDSGLYTGVEAPPPSSLGTDGDYYYQRNNWTKCIQRVKEMINGSSALGYGTEFRATHPLTVTHLFVKTTEERTGKLQIGTISEILAETENVLFPANEWVEVPLESPIQLSPGTNYVVKAVIDSTYSSGKIGWVYLYQNLSYTPMFSYVRLRTGTSWPGTEETTKGVLVGISYLTSDGLYRIRKQFYKSSGSWSEIT